MKNLEGNIGESQLIVVDSQAKNGVRLFIRKEFKDVLYIPFIKNAGYAKIVNAGIKASTGEYILVVNADIEIAPSEIEKIRSFLEQHKNAGAVGVTGCFRYPNISAIFARRTIWANIFCGRKALADFEMRDYNKKEPREVDWVRGDCWMIKKTVVKKVGLLDEQFFMYLEDTDWCRRANNFGYKIYFLPGIAAVQHRLGASRQFSLKGLNYRITHFISFLKYLSKWKKIQ